MDLPVVDFRNHGPLTMDRFYICKRRLRIKKEFLPLSQRRFRNERKNPYPGYKTQRDRTEKPSKEKISLAVERTNQVVKDFQKSDQLMLRIQKEELDERWEAAGGKWWKFEEDPDNKLANDHYFDLVRLFNDELHQKYWEEDDWFNLWDHATSNEGYLPMNW